MKRRVAITRHLFDGGVSLLRETSDVTYVDRRNVLPRDELLALLRDHDAAVVQLTDAIDGALLEALPRLRVIANVAVGYDNIDVDAATRCGVLVTNTPGVLTETTADFAFALLLAAARRVVEADRFVRARKWRRWEIDLLCGVDVHHRVLGILGAGRIGQAVARRARGFEMDVVYHQRTRLSEALEAELGLRWVSRDELLRASDFVSVHVPLTRATRHSIGAREFEVMKETAVFVNTARGEVVDERELTLALAEGRIAAAGIDVFEREPEVEPTLYELDNVVLAPHLGSASIATRERMSIIAAQSIVDALTGREPAHGVNPEVWSQVAAALQARCP